MAANAVALRHALNRLGMGDGVATFVMDEANGLGLNTPNIWRDKQLDEDLDGLAKNIRNPGGTMTNAAGNQVRHNGFQISVKTLSNLKVLRIALKHYQQIQRPIVPGDINEEWIATWSFLVDTRRCTKDKKPSDLDELPSVSKADWPKTFETIDDYFSDVYGEDGTPLAYVLRDDEEVEDAADDPQDGYEGDLHAELIARAPHEGETYRADNRLVCRVLKKIVEGTNAFSYVRSYTADGRAAYFKLKSVFLGPQTANNQATIQESRLQNTTYTGETARFGFNKLVEIHKTAHNRLEALVDHGYAGIDEGTKIRHFLNSIKTEKLKLVVELVRNNPDYTQFDDVVRRIQDTVETKMPTIPGGRRISSVVTTNANGKEVFTGVEPDMSMEDKFYSNADWAALTDSQKKGVLLKRQEQKSSGGGGGEPGKQKSKSKSGNRKFARNMKRKIKALQRKVAALSTGGDDSDSSDEPELKKPKKGHRGHDALRR